MTTQPPSSAPAVSRLTGFILGLVVFVCVTLIGFAGYVKYQIDVAESVLSAPAVSSATHLAAQNDIQFWAMLLTVACWSSLIIAAAMAAAVYLTLRTRQSAPMRALAQSVSNMARGDLRSSIWGMERQDMIGELARAVDRARYHFTQLPDMSLLSDQGPVRIRFEGNTRSLFEAMMRVISRDSEHIREQATGLTDAVMKQQEAIALISSRVEAVLSTIEKRGLDGDQRVKQALQSTLTSAQSLKNAQEHAADQLNRILPFLQDRAQGMAEITQITGKQVAQVLQSLTLAEKSLRASADQSQEAIKKLSVAGDDVGERLFGAINLLQASGKVLAETSEKTQSRLNEAINSLNPAAAPAVAPAAVPVDTSRLEAVAAALEAAQRNLEERISSLTSVEKSSDSSASGLEMEPIAVAGLMSEIKLGFETIVSQMTQMREQFASGPASSQATAAVPVTFNDQMRDQWYQMAAQIEASRGKLEETITRQIDRLDARFNQLGDKPTAVEPALSPETQQQMEQQAQILSELVATLSLLDEHMQQLKSEIGNHRENMRVSKI
ncbi:MAG: hypothetical protein SFW62_00860 [Alphaproteobacteria bacterium]|nr:hypothetical protein [Alphaproteobacteria bacterium]